MFILLDRIKRRFVMQNKNLEQIRTVIKMFFNEYDMEDIYNYIDNNISMNEIKIISNKNRIKFSIRERFPS